MLSFVGLVCLSVFFFDIYPAFLVWSGRSVCFCVFSNISFLAGRMGVGLFFLNCFFCDPVPAAAAARRHHRVRPVRPAAAARPGFETT